MKHFLRIQLSTLVILSLLSPACIWKLWKDEKPLENKEMDIYGTVVQITPEKLVLQTDKGQQTFVMVDSSVKGGDFGKGAYVHVFYRIRNDQKEVRLAVEKINH